MMRDSSPPEATLVSGRVSSPCSMRASARSDRRRSDRGRAPRPRRTGGPSPCRARRAPRRLLLELASGLLRVAVSAAAAEIAALSALLRAAEISASRASRPVSASSSVRSARVFAIRSSRQAVPGRRRARCRACARGGGSGRSARRDGTGARIALELVRVAAELIRGIVDQRLDLGELARHRLERGIGLDARSTSRAAAATRSRALSSPP